MSLWSYNNYLNSFEYSFERKSIPSPPTHLPPWKLHSKSQLFLFFIFIFFICICRDEMNWKVKSDKGAYGTQLRRIRIFYVSMSIPTICNVLYITSHYISYVGFEGRGHQFFFFFFKMDNTGGTLSVVIFFLSLSLFLPFHISPGPFFFQAFRGGPRAWGKKN